MKILLATNNAHKLTELKGILKGYEIYAFNEVLKPFEIEENGTSFKENALLKSKAVFEALNEAQRREFVVLSDDSGISVEALNNAPNIHSARFSPQKTDKANREKLISELKALNLSESKAFYTACIAISSAFGDYTTHGFMHGRVITQEKGENGFGYDALFIPKGFEKTLGELDEDVKARISHRFKALSLMGLILNLLKKELG
ncbi:RdgB/HAM1 family non-canonical purine NTP pyrophosphatase [Campylobacter troglodytis]|uniref:RdgB/HAM1 family non-canonical purine NTP pyrophosphatase n=1 Tax=Campylobacter troglodytis TaxID=654363 RepID=UPI00115A16BC|nr:RdgB/HAM1 family non-canonical purine NTP pyrophosphatase [Campylobacter troglodytis]TQR59078.1 non-canonical purine NTP pyrophosphatase, RdgB/HAM1 family [Campylobacter troglodytis]